MADKITKQQGRILLKMARASIGEKLGIGPGRGGQCRDTCEDDAFLNNKQGLFVTLHQQGELRGCIGTIEPVKRLGQGVCENAVFAAFEDHRFTPLTRDEFDDVDLELSLLSRPKRLDFSGGRDLAGKLVPHRDGVILEKDGARATFLPQVWKQLPKTEDFLRHLCLKAGLSPNAWEKEIVVIYTYEVQSFAEKESDQP